MFLKRAKNYDRVNMVKMCLLAVHTSVVVNAILQTLLITIFMRKKVRRWSRRMKNKKMIFRVSMKNKMNRARRDEAGGRFRWGNSRRKFQNPESWDNSIYLFCSGHEKCLSRRITRDIRLSQITPEEFFLRMRLIFNPTGRRKTKTLSPTSCDS